MNEVIGTCLAGATMLNWNEIVFYFIFNIEMYQPLSQIEEKATNLAAVLTLMLLIYKCWFLLKSLNSSLDDV